MNLHAEPGTSQAIVEVCDYHLGRDLIDQFSELLHTSWFVDLESIHVAEKSLQKKAVEDIQKSLSKALRSFYSLHPDVRRAIEWQVASNLSADKPETTLQTFTKIDGEFTPIKSFDNLELLLRSALSSFIGQPADTPSLESTLHNPKQSARSAAKSALSDINMKNLTPQADTNEAWKKALTVKRCRFLWFAVKQDAAPKTYSGPFGRFLSDVVIALNKHDEWKDGSAIMRAWKERSEQNEWFL